MAVTSVTSVIETYQMRFNSKPYVPSTTSGHPTLGASCAVIKLFLALLSTTPRLAYSSKDVSLIRHNMVCCKCGLQIFWCVETYRKMICDRKYGYGWRLWRNASTSACSASTSIRHSSWFQQSVTLISLRFCSSHTSFAHTNTIERTWRNVKSSLSQY